MSPSGRYITTTTFNETVRAFVPDPLPPNPPLKIDAFYGLLDEANQAIGRLDGLQASLPDIRLLLYFYNLREAVLSSQIEGTQSSLSELLLFEEKMAPPAPDAKEVSNYVAAMQHGLQRLRDGFPFSNRLLKEMHAILLRSGRGSEQEPGEFRRSQNWIGGSRPGNAVYVPPPVAEMEEVMSQLERFLHRPSDRLPLLVDAALAHVQFESAHPFLDGNGRIGRILITLLLCERRVLREPSLYLSLFLKRHREQYYRLLQEVRERGSWEPWIEFFLEGVRSTAVEACESASRIRSLFEGDRQRIQSTARPGSLLQAHEFLQRHPVTAVPQLARGTHLANATAGAAIDKLLTMGVVSEQTGRRRGRIFYYTEFLNILNEGTEPLP